MKKDIKKLVNSYIRRFDTSNPFEIADALDIIVRKGKIDFEGCYMFLKNHRCIFLNEDLSEHEMTLVMAHELGHAIMHRKDNCYFVRNYTMLLNSKIEIEANQFAMYMLVSDELLMEHQEYTTEQLSRLTGYDENLLELRMK